VFVICGGRLVSQPGVSSSRSVVGPERLFLLLVFIICCLVPTHTHSQTRTVRSKEKRSEGKRREERERFLLASAAAELL